MSKCVRLIQERSTQNTLAPGLIWPPGIPKCNLSKTMPTINRIPKRNLSKAMPKPSLIPKLNPSKTMPETNLTPNLNLSKTNTRTAGSSGPQNKWGRGCFGRALWLPVGYSMTTRLITTLLLLLLGENHSPHVECLEATRVGRGLGAEAEPEESIECVPARRVSPRELVEV